MGCMCILEGELEGKIKSLDEKKKKKRMGCMCILEGNKRNGIFALITIMFLLSE